MNAIIGSVECESIQGERDKWREVLKRTELPEWRQAGQSGRRTSRSLGTNETDYASALTINLNFYFELPTSSRSHSFKLTHKHTAIQLLLSFPAFFDSQQTNDVAIQTIASGKVKVLLINILIFLIKAVIFLTSAPPPKWHNCTNKQPTCSNCPAAFNEVKE